MPKLIEILLLEDNDSDAQLIGMHLKQLGIAFNLSIVQSREEYIKSISVKKPDVILCDYSIPGYSGLSAFTEIKEMDIKVPFILITGALSDGFAAEIAKVGITDYLMKDRLFRLPIAVKNCLVKPSDVS